MEAVCGHCLLVLRPHTKNVFPVLWLARKEASLEGEKSSSVCFFSIIFLSCIGMILKILDILSKITSQCALKSSVGLWTGNNCFKVWPEYVGLWQKNVVHQ